MPPVTTHVHSGRRPECAGVRPRVAGCLGGGLGRRQVPCRRVPTSGSTIRPAARGGRFSYALLMDRRPGRRWFGVPTV